MVHRTTSPHPLYIPVHIQTDNRQGLHTQTRQTKRTDRDESDHTCRQGSCDIFEADPDPWIRTLDLDPDPALHVTVFQETDKKYRKCFCLFTVGTFTSVFKDSKLLRSHKTVEIINKLIRFLIFFTCWWKDPQILTNDYGSGRPKNFLILVQYYGSGTLPAIHRHGEPRSP